jgi:hypothetical protein
MGTDIHLFIERKFDNKWEKIDLPDVKRKLDQRNYDAFAVLGGVRNGTGFAGCLTGSKITPISSCRGIPEDSNKKTVQSYLSFDHSASHVYLNELAEYNFDEGVTKYGVISKKDFINWDRKTPPENYCGGIMGNGVIVVTQEEATNILENELDEKFTDVQVSWSETIADGCFNLIYARDMLLSYCGQNNVLPEHIRLVFDFDS